MWLRNHIQEPRLHFTLPLRIISAQVYVWTLASIYLSSSVWFLIAKWKDFYSQTHNFPAELETATCCVFMYVRKTADAMRTLIHLRNENSIYLWYYKSTYLKPDPWMKGWCVFFLWTENAGINRIVILWQTIIRNKLLW